MTPLLLWRLVRYAPKLALLDAGLWILIAGFFPAIPGVIIQQFFNALTDSAAIGLSPEIWIGILVATSAAEIVTVFAGQWVRTQYRFNLRSLLRTNLLDGLLQQPGAQPLTLAGGQNTTISPGEAISYFRDDPEAIEQLIAKTADFVGQGLFALGAIALLLSINARLTLLVFLPLAAITAVVQQAQRHIKRYRRASRQATQAVTGFLGELFASVQVLKAAGTEAAVLNRLQQVNERRRQLMVKDQLLTATLDSLFENLTNLGIGLILLLVATAPDEGSGTLAVGDFALFVYYLTFVTQFFQFAGGYLTLLKQTDVSFDRLTALHRGSSTSNPAALALVAHTPLHIADLLGPPPPLPPIEQPHRETSSPLQDLVLSDLTYHYPGTDRGITSVSVAIPRGNLTVITGPIGSGKTTLLQVLLGLLPAQAGTIYWNGQPVDDAANFFGPPRTAYTPQVPQLFSDSLGNNILLGLQASPKALETAIHHAVFEHDLAAMPQGLTTPIGPRGVRLSGGQLQRAAAARMFIRQPELLVFDDLSSALDVETEQQLWQRLLERPGAGERGRGGVRESPHHPNALRAGSVNTPSPLSPAGRLCQHPVTLLIVSHRPEVLRRADQIIVLDNGKVEAMGCVDELSPEYFPAM